MSTTVSKADHRAARARNAARYQPKLKPANSSVQPIVGMRLRRLTAKALEELRRPDSIPSAVIYAALVSAASGK